MSLERRSHRRLFLLLAQPPSYYPRSSQPLLVGERKVAVAVYSLPLIEEEKQSVVEGLPPATPSPNVAAALPEQRSEPVALPLEREDGRERMLKLPVSAAKTCRCYTHRHRLLAPPEAEESREREKIATPPHGTKKQVFQLYPSTQTSVSQYSNIEANGEWSVFHPIQWRYAPAKNFH
nr:hypothetical protein Iba_chr05dCG9900 [Ipomoea batatas]